MQKNYEQENQNRTEITEGRNFIYLVMFIASKISTNRILRSTLNTWGFRIHLANKNECYLACRQIVFLSFSNSVWVVHKGQAVFVNDSYLKSEFHFHGQFEF